jgi:hypothetical protein
MSEVRTIAGGPPVPSLQLVQCDQISVKGDGSHERPLHANAGLAGGGASIVFRPGGVATENVVTTWIEVLDALALAQGARTVQFDDSIVSPIQIPASTTAYPMLGVTWESYPGRSAQILVPEGVSFTELRHFVGVRVTFSGTTPPVSDFGSSGSPVDPVVIELGASVTTSGAGPFFRFSAAGTIRLGEVGSITTGTTPVVDVAVGTTLNVSADGPFAALRASTVSGVGGATLVLGITNSAAGDSNGSLSESQSAFLGTISPRNFTAARSYPTAVLTGNTVLSSASLTARVDPTAAGFTVTLPSAALFRGQRVRVKNVSNSVNVVVVAAGAGDNIDGAATQSLSAARFSSSFESDGVHQWMAAGG